GVLRLDPGTRLGRVERLEPAVRVGDLRAVVVVDLVDGPRLGVVETAHGAGALRRAPGRVVERLAAGEDRRRQGEGAREVSDGGSGASHRGISCGVRG